jgi:hypothetical protein
MENEKALTIDPEATKKRIKADGRTPASWARMHQIPSGTAQRVFAGSYPHTDSPHTEYQRVLKALLQDGYLVQVGEAQMEKSAA